MNFYEILKASKGLPTDFDSMLFARKTGKINTEQVTVSGYPCIIENSAGKPLVNYKIYGNTVQNGTPSPENPVEIQSVGKLIENGGNSGKYEIPVVSKSENREPVRTSIFLDEPLRKIGDYADFIDFESSKIVKNVDKKVFDGSEEISLHYYFASHSTFRLPVQLQVPPDSMILSTHAENVDFQELYYNGGYGICSHNTLTVSNLYIAIPNIKKPDEMKSFLKEQYEKGTPVTVYYPLANPITETAELPEIPTFSGTTAIETDTEISPSNMEITYKSKK